MNCAEIRQLLHACLDGELDLPHALDVEHHLKTCPACATDRANFVPLRATLANRA